MTPPVHELTIGWTYELQTRVATYVVDHGMFSRDMLRVDLVLVLLRIGGEEALQRVAELTGKAITRCPSAMPPWPPKPIQSAPRGVVVTKITQPYPGSAGTVMAQRYAGLKLGMTQEQILARGITLRDLRVWKSKGHIELGEA